MLISDVLPEGQQNAVTCKYLCKLLDITPRQVSRAIEMERRRGVPICASSGDIPGYYLAANKREMESYCGRLKHRIQEVQETRRACLKTLDALPEKEEFDHVKKTECCKR